ncbi:hypothetical protein NNJEOMEG_03840 [Fundidesulfovibrio magnetotacticus]|uniref:TadE-like domain-containing protein n=1 Tax=Fundidesulfovibrio magnetotacticus TaxID=2730080 RepID=A0A6V8M2C3_9BACT|nr:TadE/TadG family type IV pilus assembly protein [Fundidesulfovibrio magnetotacticus]GFK95967.1 hypothetical protein NNJEOMEG_03840 [Fundidesulfovibrio magnetotacticus]
MNAHRDQSGVAAVEFALIGSLVLIPLVIAILDFSQMFQIRQVVAQACEVGALAASDGQAPEPLMRAYVQQAGQDSGRLGVAVTANFQQLPPGTAIRVDATFDLRGLPIIPWGAAIPGFVELTAQATARRR